MPCRLGILKIILIKYQKHTSKEMEIAMWATPYCVIMNEK